MTHAPLKPPSRVLAGCGLRRYSRTVVSRELEEAVFQYAEVLSEGYCRSSSTGRVYFGSTMIAVELSQLAKFFRGPLEDVAREELASAVDGSVRIRLRAMRLACAEVARRLRSRVLGTAQVETRVQVTGDRLLIDVDLEVPVGLSSGSERS